MPLFGRRVIRLPEAVLAVLVSAGMAVFGLLVALRWIPFGAHDSTWFPFVYTGAAVVVCAVWSRRLARLLRARRRGTDPHGDRIRLTRRH